MLLRASTLLAAASYVITFTSNWGALGYDATKRECDGLLCLTSFIWCATGASIDAGQEGCSYPEDAWPYFNRETPSNPALLLTSSTYNITWKNADSEYPVRIRWSFQDGRTSTTAAAKWETSKITQNEDHQRHTTDPFYLFTPENVFDQFPTDLSPDLTAEAANGLSASDIVNIISISQPELSGTRNVTSYSQQFIVQSSWVKNFIETAESKTYDTLYHKWKLGVGIGVGVGVPIIMALTGFTTFVLARRRQSPSTEPGDQKRNR